MLFILFVETPPNLQLVLLLEDLSVAVHNFLRELVLLLIASIEELVFFAESLEQVPESVQLVVLALSKDVGHLKHVSPLARLGEAVGQDTLVLIGQLVEVKHLPQRVPVFEPRDIVER